MIDYSKAASLLGVDVASVKAVASVESGGSGFIKDPKTGKDVPKILFERHIMFKRLRDNTSLKSAELAQKYPDLVNPTSGGYKGGYAEHERLQRAVAIDRDTALESASWGAYQIMGHHWLYLGYTSLQSFINDMYTDQGQLDAFVRFIRADGRLVKALREKDWTTFARLYNGPAYAKNDYHIKMKAAYDKFSKA